MRGSVSVRGGCEEKCECEERVGEVCGTKVMSSARTVLDTNVAVASFFPPLPYPHPTSPLLLDFPPAVELSSGTSRTASPAPSQLLRGR